MCTFFFFSHCLLPQKKKHTYARARASGDASLFPSFIIDGSLSSSSLSSSFSSSLSSSSVVLDTLLFRNAIKRAVHAKSLFGRVV